MHAPLFTSCDCGCTCDRPDDGVALSEKATIYWGPGKHDARCRIFDPELELKAGNRRYLIRSA